MRFGADSSEVHVESLIHDSSNSSECLLPAFVFVPDVRCCGHCETAVLGFTRRTGVFDADRCLFGVCQPMGFCGAARDGYYAMGSRIVN